MPDLAASGVASPRGGVVVTQSLHSRLPFHHVARTRLSDRCSDERFVVVEAAGGYGKSVLGAEITDAWGIPSVWVTLEPGGVSDRLLAGRLLAAVADAGFTDAAAAMAAAQGDPVGAVDAMVSGLRGEACAIVIDDAHNADSGASLLIDRIADRIRAPQRLIVLARQLPAGLARLRRIPAPQLVATDLALRHDETLALCREGFGLSVSIEDAQGLDLATGGWTAAAVLAASRARQTGQPLDLVAPSQAVHRDAMHSILDAALSSSGRDRQLFALIAAPPLLDRELLTQVTGELDFLDRAFAWGLPMTQVEGGWWVLPDPVREHMLALGTSDNAVLMTAANHYQRRGQLGRALQMLLGAGEREAAAQILASSEPWVIDTVTALELLSVLDGIPDQLLDRHPRALLTVARCCAGSWLYSESDRLLERLEALLREHDDPALRLALEVELLVKLVDRGQSGEAERRARRILAAAEDPLTKARALTVLGQALSGKRDHEGRLDLQGLREAADCLRRATELQIGLGNRPAAATITIFQGLWIELQLGHAETALEVLDSGRTLAFDHPRRFVQILFCRAHVLTELGRHDEAEAELEEVLRIGRRLGDRWMIPYVLWERMRAASMRGDDESTVRHARAAITESQTGNWWVVDGQEFLADAADCLDRVGFTALATEYLERARRETPKAEPQLAMAACALLARHGDPGIARERLAEAELQGIAPRERWRVTLLDAYAAHRQGDRAAAALAARAFEQAAEIGQPQAPLLCERELTDSLLALAVETGMPAARDLSASSLPIAIGVLGRFELSHGGRTVALGNSQEARLLKLVAVSGVGMNAEQAIDALWPEVDPQAGRNRLRTVLNRLRDAAPGAVVRDGDRLVVGAEATVDVTRFEAEAREAQALNAGRPSAAAAIARCAIARYQGSLLPSDLYEEWADEPREQAQRTMLGLLDLCAEAAAQQGDLDEARRMVERAIELAPYDEHRYLRVASILHRQGRKGAALSVLRRARSALAKLEIEPPKQLTELELTISSTAAEQQPLQAPAPARAL